MLYDCPLRTTRNNRGSQAEPFSGSTWCAVVRGESAGATPQGREGPAIRPNPHLLALLAPWRLENQIFRRQPSFMPSQKEYSERKYASPRNAFIESATSLYASPSDGGPVGSSRRALVEAAPRTVGWGKAHEGLEIVVGNRQGQRKRRSIAADVAMPADLGTEIDR
jgi:hypothetical protein